AVGDEDLVAGRDHRQQRGGDSGQPRGGEYGAGGALELGYDFFDCAGRGIAGAAVAIGTLALLEFVQRPEQNSRAAEHGGVDETEMVVRSSPGMGKHGFNRLSLLRLFTVVRQVHLVQYSGKSSLVHTAIRPVAALLP